MSLIYQYLPFYVDIEHKLNQLELLPKTQLPDSFDSILQTITNLEKQVNEALVYIPAYDERKYRQSLKELSATYTVKKSQLTPKSKFSFKSRRGKPTEKPKASEDQAKPTQLAPANKAQANYTFADQNGSYLNLDSSVNNADSQSKDCLLHNLRNCIVNLVSETPLTALLIDTLENCVVLCGPLAGSLIAHRVKNCVLVIACHQFRLHESTNLEIYLHATSHPIIEDSTQLRFGRYNLDYVNMFSEVEDFNWLKKSESPNWTLIPDISVPASWPLEQPANMKTTLLELLPAKFNDA
ncbi:TBCC-domain-containing protein [Basidiobolus meristosporus CBS 931.73]|uniref:TBCC-domain-containing protein n=1 Tax=Basidiobolus meristosporus CBS 931.73 TaxID=1314790 RepID=A0A1Y1Y2N0_9FUNG|nr:TBCC-domain-containing protein [Basidiobolus meristosporus CBS 931.73]|eukprot:ORX91874.1 TBCC-domain-containing protein [Basidiobolus meristosporus CBS 931.73]